jgi:hypothetical protein
MWRLVVAAGLLAVAFGAVPVPVPNVKPNVQPEAAPSPGMQSTVADVKVQLSRYSRKERAKWAELWTDAAKVVVDPVTAPSITDTPTLRAYQVEMLKIGWVVLGDHSPGANPLLDSAVNAAFTSTLTTDDRPVTPEVLSQYHDLCLGLAWAAK